LPANKGENDSSVSNLSQKRTHFVAVWWGETPSSPDFAPRHSLRKDAYSTKPEIRGAPLPKAPIGWLLKTVYLQRVAIGFLGKLGPAPGVFPGRAPAIDSAVNRLYFRGNQPDDNSMLFFRKKKTTVEFVPVVLPDPIDPNVPRKKILVVDDDPIMVKTLSLTLTAKGYDVLSATDGSQAISVIREQNPDMMLVDVGLAPDVGGAFGDGFQVTQWLLQANFRKIPAIIISGSDKPAYKRQAAAVGADSFMAKPINKELLLDSIEAALANPAPVVEGVLPALKMADGSAEAFAS
jgi:CheY-like chemotaxis protein